jgi:hypothetical protein
MDRLIGGVGNRWQVEILEAPWRYVLRARMKLPGRAWLLFQISSDKGSSLIRQTAMFDPRGLAGRAYWYLTLPIHGIIFSGMLKRIADRSGNCDI